MASPCVNTVEFNMIPPKDQRGKWGVGGVGEEDPLVCSAVAISLETRGSFRASNQSNSSSILL